MSTIESVRQLATSSGQDHVFQHFNGLSKDEQKRLYEDVKDVDFQYLANVFKASMATGAASSAHVKPYPCVLQLDDVSEEQRKQWKAHGLRLMAQGKAAVLLLAGGQGTRLGSSLPKGCYNVGLPSGKSLFQLQAERLLKMQQLAAAAAPSGSPTRPLHWYIMTSPFTHVDTLSHFEEHNFFGLQRSQVTFFQQGFLPCLTEEGKIIMESPQSIAKAPDGNGGVYMALHKSGCLNHMVENGVECLDVYCVDNILARLADPLFLGYCHSMKAEVGARVVAKAFPEEKVGVFASRDGALTVVEYSEIDPQQACAVDPASGKLLYNWSNICMHYFSISWLLQVHSKIKQGSAYHVARKQIPSMSGPVAGIKLELFIFDTFPLADKERVVLVEVAREEQFAPVKNAPGSATDSPDTAKAAVMKLHSTWVKAAGATVSSPDGVEVSPLVSYAGEGLAEVCAGAVFSQPWVDSLQKVP
eukprot:CAMPEP_0202904818 /NCGR_PEP_ID=MMETSP1392-20130828/31237_1 /ASSEMBLY_ACC=CAM_ASM_000868 /TAXON_ID=225041 /ORGANISM="Chlamydomonas chlamydogama, Strain SAG 11-48b" /LENGTH=471 /DNA_ID=CAMNT_0049592643 /DNA_START=73 /DNA_END=1488 /DNA_ORIENTATION=-